MVGQLEQPLEACVQQECLAARVAGDVQVGSADVADQERVAAEDKPRLLCPTPPIGDRVCVMRGRVPRRRDRGNERVPELDHIAVGQCNVLELDSGTGRQVSGRARARDELGQAGHVVRLHVRLEDRHDRRAQRGRVGKVAVDELGVRVDDRELGVRPATEQVAGARRCVVQKRA
jgi:hypothetical protein